jgi:hypothetical protein
VSEDKPQFQLPKDIERYLAALSKVYARDGERQKQEVLVNSQVRIHEDWTRSYSFDEESYGHALYLLVPESLYLNLGKQRYELQEEFKNDINNICNVRGEFIAQVFLEMESATDRDWRQESGVLLSRQRVIVPTTEQRIWGDKGYRVFLSHKAEVKSQTAQLKERLTVFGMSAFVAHTDIHPTREWQDEIENALASMDAFVALLSENFHGSEWTDQEVGYALGRGVPMIAVKLGKDPYGFIGKFQALACDWDGAPLALVNLLIRQPRMLDAFINAVSKCFSYDDGNTLSQMLPAIDTLTMQQAEKLVTAFNTNCQLQGSYGFSGSWPSKFGPGLAAHLNRVTGTKYVMTSSGQIEGEH